MDEPFLPHWMHAALAGVDATLVASLLGGLLLLVVVARAARTAAARHIADPDTRYRVRKAITFATTAVAVLLLLATFSQRLTGLTVAFGVAGAGIAFALQEVIASIAGWIAVLFGGYYAPGDRVQLGGVKGDVIDISVLRTTLMEIGQWVDGDLYNGRIVRVANSFVLKEPVVNYTADFPFLWDEIKVPITYGSDRALTRRLLEEAVAAAAGDAVEAAQSTWATLVRKFRIEDARITPFVTLVANDNWMEFTVRYVVDYRRRRVVKDALFMRVLDAVDASEGRMALASATFQLVGAPPITVRLDRREGDAAPSARPATGTAE